MDKTIATLHVPADLAELMQVRQFVEETAVAHISNQQTISDIVLAVDEAVTNIIRHGYQQQSGTIEIIVHCHPHKIEIKLCDDSPQFDPTTVSSPNPATPLSHRKPGGMGVHMMRHLTDKIQYQQLPDGRNELTLIKNI